MKIAMIGHKRIPSREGGVEIVVEEIASRMVKLNNEVHVYNRGGHHIAGKKYDSGNIKDYKGIRIITIPTFKNGKLNALVYSFNATLRAIFGKYDVIHYHAEGACAMMWIPHIFGIRTVATIHGLDWKRAKWGGFAKKYLKHGEKVAVRYADEIIVLSQNTKKYFKETYGRDVQYIPNGITRPHIREDKNISSRFGINRNNYILFLARIVPEKGLHYLIEAYKELDTDKKLVIAGGSSHTDMYLSQIKNMAAEDNRIIMTGFVSGEILEELYSNAYIYVLPSDIEGMPISLLEAMSYGNCCLVSDIDENIEVIKDKGVSFEKSNIADLRQKLQYLIEAPVIVDMYRNNAADYVCNEYNWEHITKETLDLYKK